MPYDNLGFVINQIQLHDWKKQVVQVFYSMLNFVVIFER